MWKKWNNLYYFDGDTIKKEIKSTSYGEENFSYWENELDIQTAENRTIVLPKTAKGKPKKLNYTATQSFNPHGVYFRFEKNSVRIGNYTTQKTFYSESFYDKSENKFNSVEITSWLEKWIKETTEKDLEELLQFKHEKRTHQKYKEGDIFAFKIGRREYGFGKIVIDIVKRRKTEEFKKKKNYGLANLFGTALMVKIYHKISDTMNIDMDELEKDLSLPCRVMMDNHIYYDENKIIGHRPVNCADLDEALISVSQSINGQDLRIAYLQYGLIYKEVPLEEYKKEENEAWNTKDYRAESIGYYPDLYNLRKCIQEKSNAPYYDKKGGSLNSPHNKEDKKAVFKFFGLDADLDYEGNWKLYLTSMD